MYDRLLQAVVAVQGATLLALAIVDYRRKQLRKPASFPAPAAVGHRRGVGGHRLHLRRGPLPRHAGRHPAGQDRVFFETFIWKCDAVGQAFKDALIDAADRGVKVYLVFDEFANLVVPRRFFHFPANIAVRRHPLIASGFRFPRNTGRDHRKVLVVDDHVAFLGGYNIGGLYATDWRDTHARLTGDIVWDVQNAFIDYWNLWAGRRRPPCPISAAGPGSPTSGSIATCRAPWSTRSAACTSMRSTAPRTTST